MTPSDVKKVKAAGEKARKAHAKAEHYRAVNDPRYAEAWMAAAQAARDLLCSASSTAVPMCGLIEDMALVIGQLSAELARTDATPNMKMNAARRTRLALEKFHTKHPSWSESVVKSPQVARIQPSLPQRDPPLPG